MSRLYKYFLGTEIGPRTFDVDATAYLTAVGIPNDSTIYFSGTPYEIQGKQYWYIVNELFKDLKSSGIYTKMYAFWPLIGGTAVRCKWNAKDPRDTNAAYRLTYAGGITFSGSGMQPNGTNGYAATQIQPNIVFNNTDLQAFGYFSRTNSAYTGEYVMGSNSGSTNAACALIARRNDNLRSAISDFTTATYRAAEDNNSLNGAGFFIGSQQGTSIKLYINGSVVVSNTDLGSNVLGTRQVVLGAINSSVGVGGWTNKECSFAFVSKKLTDGEVTTLNTIVQNFNYSLNR